MPPREFACGVRRRERAVQETEHESVSGAQEVDVAPCRPLQRRLLTTAVLE